MKIAFIIITCFIMLVGCKDVSKINNNEVMNLEENKTSISNELTETEKDVKEISDFSIKVNGKYISLREWDNEVDLNEVLGKPTSEATEVLGNGADTFTGSYVKTMSYDGLKLVLFSPKQNGVSFWIQSMEVTKQAFSTSKGITIGDKLEKVKESYPDIEIFKDGKTDPNNCTYVVRDDGYNYLLFSINEGIVTGIKIYYDMP